MNYYWDISNKWTHSCRPFANGQLQKQSQQIVYSLSLSQFKFYMLYTFLEACICVWWLNTLYTSFHGSKSRFFFAYAYACIGVCARVIQHFRFGLQYDPRSGHFNSYVSTSSVDFRVLGSRCCCCCYCLLTKFCICKCINKHSFTYTLDSHARTHTQAYWRKHKHMGCDSEITSHCFCFSFESSSFFANIGEQ